MAGRWASLLIVIVLIACSGEEKDPETSMEGSSETNMSRLPTHITHEGSPLRIRAGEVHTRQVELAVDDFLHVRVEQLDIDILLHLVDSDDQTLLEVDSPTGASGFEELVWIGERAGTYRVEVVATSARSDGVVVYETLAHRPAGSSDRDFVAAEQAYRQGHDLLSRGRWSEAISRLLAGLSTFVEQGHGRREADALYRLGQAYRGSRQSELATAFLERAFEHYRASAENLLAAVTAGQLGSLRQEEGQLQRALVDYAVAQDLYRRVGDGHGVGLMASRLGTTHYLLGDLRESLECFEEAIAQLEDDRRSDPELASVLIHSGGVFLALNRPLEAGRQFERAEQLYERANDPQGRARALVRSANVAFRLRRTERASQLAEEAIALLREATESETGDSPRATRDLEAQHDLAAAHLLLGRKWKRLRKLDEATATFSEALELARRFELRQLEGALLLELGHVRLLANEADEALTQLDEAQKLLTSVGDRTGEAMARVRGVQALGALGRHAEALERLAPALAVAESLRTASDRLDVRTDYFAFRQEFFDVAVELEMQRHTLEPGAGHHRRALETHERRRSRALLDTLAQRPPAPNQRVRRDLLEREEALEEAIRQWTRSAKTGSEEALPSLLGELQAVRGDIRGEAQRAAPLPVVEPLALDELQEEILEVDSLALVYALGPQRSYLWAISASQVEVFELPKRQSIEVLASDFAERLPTLGQTSIARRQRAGHQLSKWLLGPVTERLNGQRLIVVPMGTLQLVSFAALPFPGSDDATDYLVRYHPLTLAPSLTTLVHLRRRARRGPLPEHGMAIFGDPVFGAEDERVAAVGSAPTSFPRVDESHGADGGHGVGNGGELATRSASREQRTIERLGEVFGLGFDRLVYTGVEAESLATLAGRPGGLVAIGFEANRDTFFAHARTGHRIFHFATHAFQDPGHPELSSLVLSLVDEEGRRRDGLLSVFEIARLEMATEMVVLSACRTGVGKRAAGEGVLGLTRAFFDAGARRVVSSLWPVADRSTATLMIDFYDLHLSQGLEPDIALQRAQLAMIENPATAHPYHWAAFILQGDGREPPPTRAPRGPHRETP